MSRPATQVFADIIESAGIEYAFGMPGGVTPFLFDALYDRKEKVKCVLSRHEGAAACMADAYGRLSGKPAVVMGQGLWIGSNAAYGIMEAYLAGTPMLVITETSDYAGLAQHAPYQCCTGEYGAVDLISILRSMTKYTTYANSPDEFVHGVQLAIKHAVTGRPGPAAVVVRWNAAMGKVDPAKATPKLHPLEGLLRVSPPCISESDALKAADMIAAARNPVIISGQGVHLAKAYDELRELAELTGMPVATSYMGKSTIAETHELALGMMGRIGQAAANAAIRAADLLLAVGTGLAPDNTMMLSPDYINPDKQKIIHIDIEPLNIGFTFPAALGINSEAKIALKSIISAFEKKKSSIDLQARLAAVAELKEKNNFYKHKSFTSDEKPIAPERIVADVNDVVGPDDIIVLDAGNNRIFFSKLFRTKSAGQLMAAGGAAGIGWGVPAAIAVQLYRPDRRVICIAGDGGALLNISSLETVRQYKLPINYIIMNNACLGNVNDFLGPKRRELTEYDPPNFVGIAAAMDFHAVRIDDPAELKPALRKALDHNGPALLDVTTSRAPHFSLMM